jgi:hypothetical protein
VGETTVNKAVENTRDSKKDQQFRKRFTGFEMLGPSTSDGHEERIGIARNHFHYNSLTVPV